MVLFSVGRASVGVGCVAPAGNAPPTEEAAAGGLLRGPRPAVPRRGAAPRTHGDGVGIRPLQVLEGGRGPAAPVPGPVGRGPLLQAVQGPLRPARDPPQVRADVVSGLREHLAPEPRGAGVRRLHGLCVRGRPALPGR